MPTMLRAGAAAALAVLVAAGCATTPEEASLKRRDAIATAPITHVVLIDLKDPTRTAELVADCDRTLPGIESVIAYSCGVPMVTDRANVLSDYDVGFSVGFRSEADYKAYLEDPSHQGIVARWREAWKSVKIYDIVSGAAPANTVMLPPAPAKPAAAATAPADASTAQAPGAAKTDAPTPSPVPTTAPAPSAGPAPAPAPRT